MKKIIAFTIVLAMVMTLLVACAPAAPVEQAPQAPKTDEAPKAADEPKPAEQPEAPKELKTIIAVVPRTVEVLEDTAFWAAERMGYFADKGYKLEMQQSFGTTDVKMVATGNADFCFPSPSFVLSSIEEGLPIKGICQYGARNIFGFAVLNGSAVKEWSDLKGKTIALGDASWSQIMAPDLMAAGLDPEKDVEFVVAGENRYVQVAEGKIDVLFTWEGEYYQLAAQDFDFRYVSADPIRQNASNPVVASLDLIKNDPEKVQAFVRGFQMGLYFVYCNPEAAADIACERFPAIDITWKGAVAVQDGIVAQNLGSTPEDQAKYMNPIGKFYDDKWQINVDSAVNTKIISKAIPLDQVYTMDFVSNGMTAEDKARVEKDAKEYQFKVKQNYK